MKLKDANIGNKIKLVGYTKCNRQYRQKLLSMGLIKGCTFTVTRKAPLGDPIEIKMNSFNLTLRKEEADILEVEVAS